MTDILGQNNVRINFKKADSSSKEFAFMKAHELNNMEHLVKIECNQCGGKGKLNRGDEEIECYICKGYGHYYTKNIWRTGKNTNTQLIVETDNPSIENLSLIVNHLQKLFGYKVCSIFWSCFYFLIFVVVLFFAYSECGFTVFDGQNCIENIEITNTI